MSLLKPVLANTGDNMRSLFTYSSRMTKAILIISISIAAINLYKAYVHVSEASAAVIGYDPYLPEVQKTFWVFISCLFMLLGCFLKKTYRFLICTLALMVPVWIFANWWAYSYFLIRNPNVGWMAKVNKLGLAGAEWEHAVLFLATLFLVIVSLVEMFQYRKNIGIRDS